MNAPSPLHPSTLTPSTLTPSPLHPTPQEETGRLIYLAIPPHFVDVSSDFINKHLRPHTEHPGEGAWYTNPQPKT